MAPKLSRMDAELPPGMLPDGTLDVVVEAPEEDDGPPPLPEPKDE